MKFKVLNAQKSKGKRKWLPKHHSNSGGKNKMTCECMDLYGMVMIADQFSNGWQHKCTMDLFEGQRIEALSFFGDGWHK